MPNVGLSFSPTASVVGPGANSQQRRPGPTNPVQDAIRILSFRMPSVAGASAPAPQALMGGPTALGPRLGNALAENWLRLLMQGQSPLSAGSGDLGGVPPSPPPMGGRFGSMPLPPVGPPVPHPPMGGRFGTMPLPPVAPGAPDAPDVPYDLGTGGPPRNPTPFFGFERPPEPAMPTYTPPDGEDPARRAGGRPGGWGGWGSGFNPGQ